jgi:hypothetical protein
VTTAEAVYAATAITVAFIYSLWLSMIVVLLRALMRPLN